MATTQPFPSKEASLPSTTSAMTVDRWFFVLALAIFAVGQYLASSIYLIESDEGIFGACAVRQLALGGWPLTNCTDIKPPGIFAVYEIVYSIFGSYSSYGVRIAAVIGMLFAAGMIGHVAKTLANAAAGYIAAGLFLLVCTLGQSYMALKTEMFSLAFVFVALSAIYHFQATGKKKALLLAGAAVGIATLFKQPAILMMAACGFSLIFDAKKKGSASACISNMFLLAVGLLMPLLPVAGLYYISGHWAEFYQQMWQRPLLYATHKSASVHLAGTLLGAAYAMIWPALVVSICAIGVLTRERRGETVALPQVKWILLPYFVVACIIISLGKHFFPAYFIFGWPFVIIAIAMSYRNMSTQGLRDIWRKDKIGTAALGLSLILAVVLSLNQVRLLKQLDAFGRKTGAEILAYAHPQDQLYVWGYVPELYMATQRAPASRFVVTSILFGYFHDTSNRLPVYGGMKYVLAGDWDRFMQDLTQARSFLLVDTSIIRMGAPGNFRPQSFPRMRAFMAQHCIWKATINEFPVYRCEVAPKS